MHTTTSTLAALTLFAAAATAQSTVTISADRDNTLYEDLTGQTSNGSGSSLFVGVTAVGGLRRGLVHFDVAGAVPAGARVLSASLSVNVVQAASALPVTTFVHRVLQDWGEGTSNSTGGGGGGGAPAAANDATWLHAFFPTVLWSQQGGDFAPTPSFTIALPNSGLAASTAQPGLIADVQSWIDTPAQNFGWLLKDSELLIATARRLNSSEGSSGIKPQLTVTYLLPGQTAPFGTGCSFGGGTLNLGIQGAPTGGQSIQLQVSGAPANGIGQVFLGAGLDPIGTPLQLNCRAYLPLSLFVPGPFLPIGPAGTGSAPLAIPTGVAGFLLSCQAAVLDASPLGFSVSNAAVAVLN